MKKIDWKLITIGLLFGLTIWMSLNPTIKEVETIKEIEVLQTMIDSIYIEKLVEKKVFVPKYIYKTKTEIQIDTVVKEVIVEKTIVKTKTIYKDKKVVEYIDVPRPEVGKWYAGFGYQYDIENYFSGANVQLVRKFKNDKMFSLDIGFRNDRLDEITGVSKLRPYIGGTIYFRLDNKK